MGKWPSKFSPSVMQQVAINLSIDMNRKKFSVNGPPGTVHTFQGKEAKEVILVLGCDKASMNAANWAGKNVNLLNVAITRAKYRVAIIGDKDVWKHVNYFADAINII